VNVTVEFIGGPLNGQTRQLEERIATTGYTHPLPKETTTIDDDPVMPSLPPIDTIEYRYHRRLVVNHHDGLRPETVLVQMRMVKPSQVRMAEKLVNEWRKHYGMQSIGPWPDL